MGADKSWRERDKVFSVQGQQELSTCHIFESAIRLPPVPLPAEYLRDMLSALVPMPVNSGLNCFKISLMDGPFSDGNG